MRSLYAQCSFEERLHLACRRSPVVVVSCRCAACMRGGADAALQSCESLQHVDCNMRRLLLTRGCAAHAWCPQTACNCHARTSQHRPR